MEISTTLSWIDFTYPFHSACVFATLARRYYPPKLLGGLCCSGKTELISQKPDSQLCLRAGEQGILWEAV